MRRSKLLKASRFGDFLRSTMSWWRSAMISASREARDLKSPMTTHKISFSISPMRRSIARFAALRQWDKVYDKDRSSEPAGTSLASVFGFWAVATSKNSSRAPLGPRSRNRPSCRIRLRCANSISMRLRPFLVAGTLARGSKRVRHLARGMLEEFYEQAFWGNSGPGVHKDCNLRCCLSKAASFRARHEPCQSGVWATPRISESSSKSVSTSIKPVAKYMARRRPQTNIKP